MILASLAKDDFMNLEQAYYDRVNNPSDINEHLGTLRKYGSKCDLITEMGTRDLVSAYAFLVTRPKRFITYDIYISQWLPITEQLAKNENVNFAFKNENTLEIEIDQTDLLFIDTLHTYEQLDAELKLHSDKVKNYIILHDIVSFGVIGESYDGSSKIGLCLAVMNLLQEGKWFIKEWHQHNNGLLVLERK